MLNAIKVAPLQLTIPTSFAVLAYGATLLPMLYTIFSTMLPRKTIARHSLLLQQRIIPQSVPLRPVLGTRLWSIFLSIIDVGLVASSATLLSPLLQDCMLSAQWQTFFSAKDGAAVRRIQDSLDCCGLRTTRHQAFPFPDESHDARACVLAYGRTSACLPRLQSEYTRVLVAYIVVGALSLLINTISELLVSGNDEAGSAARSADRQYGFLEDADGAEEEEGLTGNDVRASTSTAQNGTQGNPNTYGSIGAGAREGH